MSDNSTPDRRPRRTLGILGSALLLLVATASPLGAQRPAAGKGVDNCVTCHQELDNGATSPTTLEPASVHRHAGFSCADCHGGNPASDDAEVAMSAASGFTGKPTPQAIASFCGRCHSDAALMKRFDPATRIDQQAEYMTSGHGRTLAKGDTKAATCVSCHGSHGILRADDANAPVHPLNVAKTCGGCHGNKDLMSAYGVFTDQVAHYATSVHAEALMKKQDLSAPTCNDCHGNHGAAPPGVSSVANVCGTCHVRQADLYSASAHSVPFTEGGIAGCVACHGEHGVKRPSDANLGTGAESMCTSCHAEGDRGFLVAGQLSSSLSQLEMSIAGAENMLSRASSAGMEVSRPEFELHDAKDKLVNARVLVHSLSLPSIDTLVEGGQAISERTKNAGVAALKELDFRRNGLGISVFVILVAAGSVYVKVRQMEQAQKTKGQQNGAAKPTNGAPHA